MGLFHYFSWSSNIPWYIYTTSFLSVYLLMECVLITVNFSPYYCDTTPNEHIPTYKIGNVSNSLGEQELKFYQMFSEEQKQEQSRCHQNASKYFRSEEISKDYYFSRRVS